MKVLIALLSLAAVLAVAGYAVGVGFDFDFDFDFANREQIRKQQQQQRGGEPQQRANEGNEIKELLSKVSSLSWNDLSLLHRGGNEDGKDATMKKDLPSFVSQHSNGEENMEKEKEEEKENKVDNEGMQNEQEQQLQQQPPPQQQEPLKFYQQARDVFANHMKLASKEDSSSSSEGFSPPSSVLSVDDQQNKDEQKNEFPSTTFHIYASPGMSSQDIGQALSEMEHMLSMTQDLDLADSVFGEHEDPLVHFLHSLSSQLSSPQDYDGNYDGGGYGDGAGELERPYHHFRDRNRIRNRIRSRGGFSSFASPMEQLLSSQESNRWDDVKSYMNSKSKAQELHKLKQYRHGRRSHPHPEGFTGFSTEPTTGVLRGSSPRKQLGVNEHTPEDIQEDIQENGFERTVGHELFGKSTGSPQARIQQSLDACEYDMPRVCPIPFGFAVSAAAVGQCLAHHQHELSPECRSSVLDYFPIAAECANDLASTCAHVKPGSGRLHRCLITHRDEIRSSCKSYLFGCAEKIRNTNTNHLTQTLQAHIARGHRGHLGHLGHRDHWNHRLTHHGRFNGEDSKDSHSQGKGGLLNDLRDISNRAYAHLLGSVDPSYSVDGPSQPPLIPAQTKVLLLLLLCAILVYACIEPVRPSHLAAIISGREGGGGGGGDSDDHEYQPQSDDFVLLDDFDDSSTENSGESSVDGDANDDGPDDDKFYPKKPNQSQTKRADNNVNSTAAQPESSEVVVVADRATPEFADV